MANHVSPDDTYCDHALPNTPWMYGEPVAKTKMVQPIPYVPSERTQQPSAVFLGDFNTQHDDIGQ
jgi:hypothetical protein